MNTSDLPPRGRVGGAGGVPVAKHLRHSGEVFALLP